MTKSDLIKRFAEQNDMPQIHAERFVNSVIDAMVDALRRGERVEIRGFGSFEIREYRSYRGRNPKTGEMVAVKKKKMPFFKAGKDLKALVNKQK